EHRRAEPVVAEAAAALPVHGLGYATLFAVHDLTQTRLTMGLGMIAHFDADIATPHFLRDGGSRARAEEAVENEIAGVGSNRECLSDELLRFRRQENLVFIAK